MDSGEDKLSDDESSSPSKSRFGRTRKPKISEDFCYINTTYSSLKLEPKVQRRSKSKSPQKLNKPQPEPETNLLHEIDLFTNAPKQIIPLKPELTAPPVYIKVLSPELNITNRKFFKSPKNKECFEEPDIDLNKVMKIIATKTESETITDPKIYTKPVLKTYCNKRKSLTKPIVESFGLPDMTIIPQPENKSTIPKRIQELDVEINSDHVTIDHQLSLFPWENVQEANHVGGMEDILCTFNEDINQIKEPKRQKSPGKYKKEDTNNEQGKDEVVDSADVCLEPKITLEKEKKSVKSPKGMQRRNEKVLRLAKKLQIDMNVDSDPVPRRLRKESSIESEKPKNKLIQSEKKVTPPKLRKLKSPVIIKTPVKKLNFSPKSKTIEVDESNRIERKSAITSSPENCSKFKTPKKANSLKFPNKLSPKRTRSMSPIKMVKGSCSRSSRSNRHNIKQFKHPRRKYRHTFESKMKDLEKLHKNLEDVSSMNSSYSSETDLLSDSETNITPPHMRCSVMLKRCDDIVAADVIKLINKKADDVLITTQNVETISTNCSFENNLSSTDSECDGFPIMVDQKNDENRVSKKNNNKRRSSRLQKGAITDTKILENKNSLIHNSLQNETLNIVIDSTVEGEEFFNKQDLADKKLVESRNDDKIVKSSPKIKNVLVDKKKTKDNEKKEETLKLVGLMDDVAGKLELGTGSNLVILSDTKEFEMSENGNMQNCSITQDNKSKEISKSEIPSNSLSNVLEKQEQIDRPINSSNKSIDDLSKDKLSENEIENAMINTYLENTLTDVSHINEIVEEAIIEQDTEEIAKYLKTAKNKNQLDYNHEDIESSNTDIKLDSNLVSTKMCHQDNILSTNVEIISNKLNLEPNNNKNGNKNKSNEEPIILNKHTNETSVHDSKNQNLSIEETSDVSNVKIDTIPNENSKISSEDEFSHENIAIESRNSNIGNKHLESILADFSGTSKEINKHDCLNSSYDSDNVDVLSKSNETSICYQSEPDFNNPESIELESNNESRSPSLEPKKSVQMGSVKKTRKRRLFGRLRRNGQFIKNTCKNSELSDISKENELNENVSVLNTKSNIETEAIKINTDDVINLSSPKQDIQTELELCSKFHIPDKSKDYLENRDNKTNNSTKELDIDEETKNIKSAALSLLDNSTNMKWEETESDESNPIDLPKRVTNVPCNSMLSLEEIENLTSESGGTEKNNLIKKTTKPKFNKKLHQKDKPSMNKSTRNWKRKSIVIDDDLSIQETQIEEIIIESSDDELPLQMILEKLKSAKKMKKSKRNNSDFSPKSKELVDDIDLRKSRKRKIGIEELGNINDDVEFIKRAIQDYSVDTKKSVNKKLSKFTELGEPENNKLEDTTDGNVIQKEIKREKLDSHENTTPNKQFVLSNLEYEEEYDVGKMLEETRLGTYKFCNGDLAYARLGKFPFWPCMIVLEPSSKTFVKKCPVRSMICPFYHVRFFGDRGRRSWVRCSNVMPLKGPSDFKKCIDYLKSKGDKYYGLQAYVVPPLSQLKWQKGFKEAISLKNSSVKERYHFFTELFEKMEMEKIVDQTVKLQKNSLIKEEDKEFSISEFKPNKSLSPKKSKLKKEIENTLQTYSLRTRQRNNSESSQYKEDSIKIVPKPEIIQKEELVESIRNKSQSDICSDSSCSDTESSSKWSIRTPVEMTQECQIALYKRNNLFRGVPRERVCQICYNPGEILKCKGKCFGYYHKSCAVTNPLKKSEKVIGEKITNEITGSEVEVVLVKNKNYQEPTGLRLNNDSVFKTLSLAEQIDIKLKEVMSPIVEKTVYADSTTDYTSSEESASEKSNDTSEVIEHVTGDDIIVVAKPIKRRKITKDSEDFKCTKCQQNKESACHVCGSEISPKGSDVRQRCSNIACGKFFHRECLKVWPQTQFSISKHKESELYSFCCPMHVCHICVSDDPRQTISRLSSDKVVKCLKCPATYHSNTHCIPAGTNILTTTQIICPRHLSYDKPAKAKHSTINTKWCFICSLGGDLICCETCPTSVHAECSSINLMDDDTFICEDCETGRLPLYDEIVWVKLGAYRWWPALTLFPNDIPERVMSVPHLKGEFVVRFFGTHDHYWVGRGRAFLFQEGDAGPRKTIKNRVEWVFQQAIEEAANAFTFKNNFKKNREDTLRNDLKPPPYIKIKVNKPVGNVKLFDGNISNTTACNCDPKSEGPCGADSYCLNRLLLTECDPEVCPAGDRCENQRFEKRQYPQLEPCKTNARGWGLKTLEPIKKGQFVIEYVGEIIDDEEYRRRIKKMHEQKEDNYYFLTIDKDRMIDAGPKGNVARFMNHCCQPNCETQKWTVKGDTRVGLFAAQDIPGDTEVTFNYNLQCAGEEKKICRCGAPTCSGFIGLKAKNIDDKKPKRKVKKKRSVTPTPVIDDQPCFVCGKTQNTFGCHNKICTKFYHFKCVNLQEPPDDKWSCPWHNCNLCTKRTIRCCVKCPNSFCPVHSEGNVRYDKLLGFICTEHDYTKEHQEIINEVRTVSSASSIITEESDVTSTTTDIDSKEQSEKSGSIHSEISLKKAFVTGKKRSRSTRNSLISRKRVKLDGTLVDNTVNIVNNVTAQKELLLTSCSSKDPKDESVQQN